MNSSQETSLDPQAIMGLWKEGLLGKSIDARAILD